MRDHPDIESIERTGYPRSMLTPEGSLECENCGYPIHHNERYFNVFGHVLCEDCIDDFECWNWGDE